MTEERPYDDPFDAAEAATERVAMRWVDRFAEWLNVSPSGWWVKLLFPLFGLLVGALVVAILFWPLRYRILAFVAVYFAPLGIETGIPTGIYVLDLHPVLLVAIVLYVDLFGGLFLVWNLDHITRIPKLGPWIGRVEAKSAAKWAKHRRLRDLGVVGLGVFVMLPISGSGAIPGAFIGRLGGFPWGLVWLAIFLGSAVRVVGYTLAVLGIGDLFTSG